MVIRLSGLIIIACLLAIFGFVAKGETRTVNVAVVGFTVNTAFTTAKEKGYYSEEGLEVRFILMNAVVASHALIARDVEFASLSGAALTAVIAGAPFRFLFSSFYRPLLWLYARPDIREVKGLRGKKVGVSSIGSNDDFLLRDLLRRHGIEADKDVAVLGLGGPLGHAALRSGSVDAAVTVLPHNFTLEEEGFRELLAFIKQEWVDLNGSAVAREGLLQSDPALVEKFIRGTLKGFLHARDNRSGTIPIVAHYLKIKEDFAAKIYDVTRLVMTPDGTVSEDLQKKALEPLLQRLGQREPPPVDKIFNYSLVRKVRAELEGQGWKPGQ
jgi:NitT/TauT family transport system substrate-binding protein